MSTFATNTATRPVTLRTRQTLGGYLALWRQRRHLSKLDSHALKDLGLSPEDVRREIKRPIWDVPANWRA